MIRNINAEAMSTTPRDIARELARRYSTMTHEELNVLERIIIPHAICEGKTDLI